MEKSFSFFTPQKLEILKLYRSFFFILISLIGCNKNKDEEEIPVVTTAEVSAITTSTAVSGGNVTEGTKIIARGVVWSTSSNPTLTDNLGKTNDGAGTGSFTSNLTLLTPSTVYYVRAFAGNSLGTVYGNEIRFRTADEPVVIPAAAEEAGYTELTFNDEFNSISSIDTATTGSEGFKWYTDRPFGWSRVERSEYSVKDGILTLANTGAGWGLDSYSCKTGNGHSFRYGYFEARIQFDSAKGPTSSWVPA